MIWFTCHIKIGVETSVSLKYRIISCTNSGKLTSSFLICTLFTSLFCFTSLAKNWSTILNKRVDILVTFLTLQISISVFTASIMFILVCDILPSLYWIMVIFFFFLVSSGILSWKNIEFYQKLSLHLLRWSCGFVLDSIYVQYLHSLIFICWSILAYCDSSQLDFGLSSFSSSTLFNYADVMNRYFQLLKILHFYHLRFLFYFSARGKLRPLNFQGKHSSTELKSQTLF
jgi:hypothetical protein